MSWIISQALMNLLCLQEQGEESLVGTCLDGEQSAPLNGNSTQQAYCAPDKMTKFSRLSRFGMTYKPLTENRGEELLMLYRGDFHAKTLAQQEEAQELTEHDQVCGNTWQGSLARLDPDTCSWKTAQCSLLEDLELSLQTFPRWGLMQNGALYPQQIPALRTSESVFGFSLPTPVSSDGTSGSVIGKNDTFYTTSTGMPRKVNQNGKDGSVGLGRLVRMWPTPTAHMAKETNAPSEHNRNTLTLTAQVNWPTPRASDYKGATSKDAMAKAAARGFSPNLPEATAALSDGGKLNPMWVEWLMGWPLGWTDLKPLGMDKFQEWQQKHGKY